MIGCERGMERDTARFEGGRVCEIEIYSGMFLNFLSGFLDCESATLVASLKKSFKEEDHSRCFLLENGLLIISSCFSSSF